MASGTRRLVRLSVPSPVKAVERSLDTRTRLVLGSNPDGSLRALIEDCADAATDLIVTAPVWTRAEFESLRSRVASQLNATTVDIVSRVGRVLEAAQAVQLLLPATPPAAQRDAIADVRAQYDRLLPAGFVARAGATRLSDLARYLTAMARRLERLPQGIAADTERMQRVHAVEDAYDDLVTALPKGRAAAADVREIAWQIQELRVSLWAQQLGTPKPVSEQRIYRAIDAVV